MVLDIETIRKFYASFQEKVDKARTLVHHPLTYTEKVLFSHLYDDASLKEYQRGIYIPQNEM